MRRATFAGALGAAAVTLRARPVRAQARLGALTLLVGTAPPDPACHFYFYALENGFYRDAGLNVEIKPIAAETTALRAVVAGDADVAWVGAISTLQAIDGGAKIKVVDCFTPRLDYQIVAVNDIANLKALAGKPFGISAIGAVSQVVPKLMIEAAGGNPNDVQWTVAGGSGSRVQALIGKRIAGAALNTPFTSRAMKTGGFHVIGSAAQNLPNYIYAWDVASTTAYTAKHAALEAFVVASARAARWAMANPDAAVAISRKLLPDVPPEELTLAANTYARTRFFSPTGAVARAAWDFTLQQMLKGGEVKAAPTFSEVVAIEFPRAASAKLGAFR